MEILRNLPTPEALADARARAGHAPLPADDPLPVAYLVALVRRRAMMILAFAMLGAALAAGATLSLQKFTAKALILVEPPPPAPGLAGIAPPSDDQALIETHIMTLLSDTHLAAVVNSLVAAHRVDPADLTMLQLERHLKVEQALHSRAITITYSDRNAGVAAAVANAVATLYVDQVRGLKSAKLRQEQTATRADIDTLTGRIGGVSAATDPATLAVLQRKLQEAMIRSSALDRQLALAADQSAGISILSPATLPLKPSTGSPVVMAVPAAVAFAILGIFVALVRERSDQSLRAERDVEDYLGVPCVGMVPRVRRPLDPAALAKLQARAPRGAYAEALLSIVYDRMIRADGAHQVLLVTSTSRQEGKSSLALGLATTAARSGRSALLIEGDWRGVARRPDAAAVPSADAAIQRAAPGGADRLRLDAMSGDPAALLGNGELAALVAKLREDYAFVIIDGPSLLGVAETAMLALLSDGVLVAVRWGRTRRDSARRALARLDATMARRRHGGDPVTAVITDVRLRRHALYRFGDVGDALGRL